MTGYHCRFLVAPVEGLGVVVITVAGAAYPLRCSWRNVSCSRPWSSKGVWPPIPRP